MLGRGVAYSSNALPKAGPCRPLPAAMRIAAFPGSDQLADTRPHPTRSTPKVGGTNVKLLGDLKSMPGLGGGPYLISAALWQAWMGRGASEAGCRKGLFGMTWALGSRHMHAADHSHITSITDARLVSPARRACRLWSSSPCSSLGNFSG